MRAPTVLLATAAGVFSLAVAAPLAGRPRLIWNATASAPEGLYWLAAADRLAVGDWAAVRPPPGLRVWLDRRGYLPAGALLIKRLAAAAPTQVCRYGETITIAAAVAGQAAPRDRAGRELPVWQGCRTLGAQQLFFLNDAPGSLDGRYFGPLPRAAVVGRAVPLWLIEGAPA
jgi:type IV secretory pathway protease TraF